jgi:hypothetical protein
LAGRAEAYSIRKEFDRAETDFRHVLDMSPMNYVALLGLSKACIFQSKWDEAAKYLKIAEPRYNGQSQFWIVKGLLAEIQVSEEEILLQIQ